MRPSRFIPAKRLLLNSGSTTGEDAKQIMPTARALPLVADNRFAAIRDLIGNRTVRYVMGRGNAGDALIHAGARCLFRRINTRVVEEAERPDFVIWGGGGNLGTIWPHCHAERQRELREAREKGIPFVIMPQSATNAEEPFPDDVQVFLRETGSQKIYPRSTLAPDLSLAFDEDLSVYVSVVPRFPAGVFLRTDQESSKQFNSGLSLGDPIRIAQDYHDYFRFISLFQMIVTDRLHFAISALMLGRETVLLPNSYHKNRGVHEAWLADLGCHFGHGAMIDILNKTSYAPKRARAEFESYRRSIQPENGRKNSLAWILSGATRTWRRILRSSAEN